MVSHASKASSSPDASKLTCALHRCFFGALSSFSSFALQGSELPEVKAVVLLDNEGARIAARYFNRADFSDKAAQADLEKKLFKKARAASSKAETEVVLLDGYTAVIRHVGDVIFCAVGHGDENELILVSVIEALVDAVSSLLRGAVDKKNVLHNLELLLLAIDETVDGGVIMELDAREIDARVMLKGAVPDSISSYKEMTVGAVVDKLKDRAAKQFAKS